jgi:redox-sensitive bicupin YhaK (pirin superfamily)
MHPKGTYSHIIPKGWNSMVVVYEGELKVQDESETLGAGKSAVFEPSEDRDEELKFVALKENTKFIMLAGKPINEPISSRGPFVLSSDEELY